MGRKFVHKLYSFRIIRIITSVHLVFFITGVSSTDTHNYSGTYEHVMNDHPPYITSSPTRLHSPSSTRLLGNRSGSAQTDHHTDSEGEDQHSSSRMDEEIPLNPASHRRMSSPYLENRGSSVHYTQGGGNRRNSYLHHQQSCDNIHPSSNSGMGHGCLTLTWQSYLRMTIE